MAQNITLMGATYSAVPAVQLPKQGGGTARFDDCTVTTATAADVASGKVFVASDGTITTGTASGGGGGVNVGTMTITNSDDTSTSISFTGLLGEPKAFFVRLLTSVSRSSSYSYYYITDIRYNGVANHGNYWRRSNGNFANDTSHYRSSYENGTLTVSSTASRSASGGSFYNGQYELVYVY